MNKVKIVITWWTTEKNNNYSPTYTLVAKLLVAFCAHTLVARLFVNTVGVLGTAVRGQTFVRVCSNQPHILYERQIQIILHGCFTIRHISDIPELKIR